MSYTEIALDIVAAFGYAEGAVCATLLARDALRLFAPLNRPEIEPFSSLEMKDLRAEIEAKKKKIRYFLENAHPN